MGLNQAELPIHTDAAVHAPRRWGFASRVVAMVGGSYALDTLVLALFAGARTIGLQVPLAYLLVGALHCCLLAWISAAPHPHPRIRFFYSPWQIVLAAGIQIVFLAIAPAVGFMFLMVLFIVFGFGSLTMTVRQAAIGWVAVALVIEAELLALHIRPQIPEANASERLLVWLFIMLTLARSILIGLFGQSFRLRLERKNTELADSFKEIHRLATTDALTGALNRHSLMALLELETERSMRYGEPLCVALLDLDHFKAVNDRFGHATGDQVLSVFASLARKSIRSTDHLSRFGGEEFLLTLTNTDMDEAWRALERLRISVRDHDWDRVAVGLTVTVSGGLAKYQRGDPIDQLLSRADRALYEAKDAGRNCVRPTAGAA